MSFVPNSYFYNISEISGNIVATLNLCDLCMCVANKKTQPYKMFRKRWLNRADSWKGCCVSDNTWDIKVIYFAFIIAMVPVITMMISSCGVSTGENTI